VSGVPPAGGARSAERESPATAGSRETGAIPALLAMTRGRGDVASAIYGLLLVTTLLAVESRATVKADFVILSVLVAVVVFWLADVWAGIVDRRLHGPMSVGEAGTLAFQRAPMVGAALVPCVVLTTAWLGVVPIETAINWALAVSVAQLFAWGLVVGRALDRGWGPALLIALVDCALGLVIVVLKVWVLH
jgi:hypothetical protein